MAIEDVDAWRRWTLDVGMDSDESAVPELMSVLLGDVDEMNRRYAAAALGRIGAHAAVPALMQAANDPGVRLVALSALKEVASPDSLPLLRDVVNVSSRRSEQREAARAMAAIADQRADDMLLEVVNHPHYDVSAIAMRGMLRRPTPRARRLLEAARSTARTRPRRLFARIQLSKLEARPD